jgi:hypothetical protein
MDADFEFISGEWAIWVRHGNMWAYAIDVDLRHMPNMDLPGFSSQAFGAARRTFHEALIKAGVPHLLLILVAP